MVKSKKTNSTTAQKKKKQDLSSHRNQESLDDSAHDDDMNEAKEESGLLNECKQLFGTDDLYAVLDVPKTCTLTNLKKAYHKVALKVHPDKIQDDALKEENTKKFQVLGKIYNVLSDDEKRKIYDETGCIDGESNMFSGNQNWESYWRTLFKKITEEDITDFFKTYRGSDKEKEDLLFYYNKYEGDMDKILESVMSACTIEDMDRFREIIQASIDNKEVDAFKAFTHESQAKRKKRLDAYKKEAEEAKKLKENIDSENDLAKMIGLKNEKRKQQSDDFFKSLEEKYAPKKKQTNKKK